MPGLILAFGECTETAGRVDADSWRRRTFPGHCFPNGLMNIGLRQRPLWAVRTPVFGKRL